MSRIQRLISPATPTLLAPRAGLVAILILGGGLVLNARHQTPAPEGVLSLPAQFTVHLRRFDAPSADGHAKAGTVDMLADHATLADMERAFASLEAIPVDPAKGHADVFTNANAPGTVDRFNYRFTGANPAQVKAIIVAQAALPPMGRKPGEIVIQRINSFTYQGGLLPKGLWVQVWAGDAPADLVLKALNELEAMTPKAGIPQEVRMRVPPGTGGGPKVTLNLMAADPLEVRDNLEKALAGAKP